MTGHPVIGHPVTGHLTGTSDPGSVILELGMSVGALVLDAPPQLHGHEIEISPVAGGPRTHSLVRERRTATKTVHAAVYPALAQGDYVVWRADGTPAGRVSIRGGQATRFRWPETVSEG
jgi:hypothetical protein